MNKPPLEQKLADSKEEYHDISSLLSMIDEPNRSACERILEENRKIFESAAGSTNNHQAWPG